MKRKRMKRLTAHGDIKGEKTGRGCMTSGGELPDLSAAVISDPVKKKSFLSVGGCQRYGRLEPTDSSKHSEGFSAIDSPYF